MTFENKLGLLRAAMAELSPAQRQVCQDYLLGYVCLYITPEKWAESVRASVDVALKSHLNVNTADRNDGNRVFDLGGEKTTEGGHDPSTGPAAAASNIPISGKDAAAGPDV